MNNYLLEVLQLAHRINEETKYCTFFRFYGHTNEFEVQITESKDNFNKNVAMWEYHMKDELAMTTYEMQELKNTLLGFLEEEGEVNVG